MRSIIIALFIGISLVCLHSSFTNNNTDPKNAAELGEKLFFDNILSADNSISCASCHKPEFAFADTAAFSVGIGGKLTKRNVPSTANMSDRISFFWDGRSATLAEQALQPIQNPDEMNLPIDEAVSRLRKHPNYQVWFKAVFGKRPTAQLLAEALAAFEKTLETANTPWDLYSIGRDTTLVSEAAKRGSMLFIGKALCSECHFTPDFTGDEFRNIGLYDAQKYTDVGRFAITRDSADLGKFKVPSLRNVAATAPYMHDGSLKNLSEVIDYYNNPQHFVVKPINRDAVLSNALLLTDVEKQDLVAFLGTLTDKRFAK